MPVPVTAVMSGTTTAGNSLWVTACGHRSLPRDTSLLLDTTSSLAVVTIAATALKILTVIIGADAAATAAAVIASSAAVGMTAPIPHLLPLSSLSARTCYSSLV